MKLSSIKCSWMRTAGQLTLHEHGGVGHCSQEERIVLGRESSDSEAVGTEAARKSVNGYLKSQRLPQCSVDADSLLIPWTTAVHQPARHFAKQAVPCSRALSKSIPSSLCTSRDIILVNGSAPGKSAWFQRRPGEGGSSRPLFSYTLNA